MPPRRNCSRRIEARVEPHLQRCKPLRDLAHHMAVLAAVQNSVEVGNIEGREGRELEQRLHDCERLARGGQCRLQRAVVGAIAATRMHYGSAHQIDNRNDLHASRPMKIFAYEHITGGGCAGQRLPNALLREAQMMIAALVNDLQAIAGVEVVQMRDVRLPPSAASAQVHRVADAEQWQRQFHRLVQETDATWLVAPERDRVLERLSTYVMESRRRLIGSSPQAVALAGSKLATAQTLLAAGVPAVPTWRIEDASIAGACVVKPDDGCGCDQTRRFASLHAARSWVALQPHPSRFVVQPYVPGDALSLSVVGGAEGSALLSVN